MEWIPPLADGKEQDTGAKPGDIFTYLADKGRLKLTPEHPFNAIDALILARISYMSFEGLILPSFDTSRKIRAIADKYIELCLEDNLRFVESQDVKLMEALKDCPRFQDLELTGYRATFSNADTEQFAAITILLPDHTAYISYRGTDGSLNGWREDFDLGFLGILPSDRDALSYMEEAFKSLSKHTRYRVGGHSKGGNLAAYAASSLSAEKQALVLELWLFDSPGFRRDVFLSLNWRSLRDRIYLFVPSQSIVGMLLYNIASATCVKSRKTMMLQHDVYEWYVVETHFVPALLQPIAFGIKFMSISVFESMNNAEVKACIDSLFDLLRDERGDHFGDLSKKVIRRTLGTVLMMRKLPPNNRQILIDAFTTVRQNMRHASKSEELRALLIKKAGKLSKKNTRAGKNDKGDAFLQPSGDAGTDLGDENIDQTPDEKTSKI